MDYWDDVACYNWECYNGLYVGWCSGWGVSDDPSYYDDNMLAYMYTDTGIDISVHSNVWIWYARLIVSEPNFDSLKVYVSRDKITWYLEDWFTGTHNFYVDYGVGIPDNWDRLYLKFVFKSDGSYHSYVGAYLDDIEVMGEPPDVDLEPYQPFGYEDAIVVANIPGTGYSTELFGNQLSYLDWHIINRGSDTAKNFVVLLEFDGVYQGLWHISALAPGASFSAIDIPFTIISGYHEISIDIDPSLVSHDIDIYDNLFFREFYWEPTTMSFSGYLLFWEMKPPAQQKPARDIRLQLWDDNFPWPDSLLATAFPNEGGYFSFDNIEAFEENEGEATRDVFFKIIAENSACFVTTQLNGNTYSVLTPIVENVVPGEYDTTIVITTVQSDAFHVADAALSGFQTWISMRPGNIPPYVQIELNTYDTSSFYVNDSNTYIHIRNNNSDPDAFDDGVVIHEYAHFLEDKFDFFDASAGGGHAWYQKIDSFLAVSEGFANFFACVALNNPRFENSYNNFATNYWRDCETGEWGTNTSRSGSANNYGAEVEGAVACILWDIFDFPNDDYSTFGDTTGGNPYRPDGIGDTLYDGAGHIMSTLMDRLVGGSRPDQIMEFRKAWFSSPSYAHHNAMRDIWHEHGINVCCIGGRGNIDLDHNEVVNILDLNYLTTYFWSNGPAPSCFDEANVNGIGSALNILDANYLVSYFFGGGPPPVTCPEPSK